MTQPTNANIQKSVEELVHTNDINPTNAEIREDFRIHAIEDHAFQDETRTNHEETKDTLAVILAEVRELRSEISNVKAEVAETRADIKPLLEILNGFIFGRKALIWTAGIAGAITAIVVAIKLLKP